MRVVVVGAGAIGGFIAGALAKSGADVAVVARGDHLKALQTSGLHVESELGAFQVALPAVGDLRELDPPDVVLATFKAHHWEHVLPQFERVSQADSLLVTLQNGVPFWYFPDRSLRAVDPEGRVLRTFAYDRIIGGVVHSSGNIPRPGTVHQSGGMLYPLGELDGAVTPRVGEIARLFEAAGLRAPIERDIRRIVWRKLLGNASLNPVSALTGAKIGPMLEDRDGKALVRAIMLETIAVASAAGCDPLIDVDERIAFAARLSDVKTSMLQDVEAGRALELEPIVGAVVELADQFKVAAPHLESVYALTGLLARARKVR